MAVHQPDSRVVRLESDDNITLVGQEHYITSWRVVKLEVEVFGVVNFILGLLKNGEIVSMKVNLATYVSRRFAPTRPVKLTGWALVLAALPSIVRTK